MTRRCHGLQSTYDHPTIYRKFSSQVSQYLNSIQATTGVQWPISQTAHRWRKPLCVSTPQPELSWITDKLLWLTWCTGTIWPKNPSRNCQPLRNGWWQLRIMGPRDSKQTISLEVLNLFLAAENKYSMNLRWKSDHREMNKLNGACCLQQFVFLKWHY
jgi:hypothetical protein